MLGKAAGVKSMMRTDRRGVKAQFRSSRNERKSRSNPFKVKPLLQLVCYVCALCTGLGYVFYKTRMPKFVSAKNK